MFFFLVFRLQGVSRKGTGSFATSHNGMILEPNPTLSANAGRVMTMMAMMMVMMMMIMMMMMMMMPALMLLQGVRLRKIAAVSAAAAGSASLAVVVLVVVAAIAVADTSSLYFQSKGPSRSLAQRMPRKFKSSARCVVNSIWVGSSLFFKPRNFKMPRKIILRPSDIRINEIHFDS